jgi:hypothetical protein
MDTIERWWQKCLYSEKITEIDTWPEQPPKEMVYNTYVDYCNQERVGHRTPYPLFFKKLQGLCPAINAHRLRQKGVREQFISFPYLDQSRRLLEHKIGIRISWEHEIEF